MGLHFVMQNNKHQEEIPKAESKTPQTCCGVFGKPGRGERIRTSGLYVPNGLSWQNGPCTLFR